MKVGVGSKNPVKIKAVENIFYDIFPGTEISSMNVCSGVSHTPSSFEETVQGAINRAKEVLKSGEFDFGVGLEEGYEKTRFGVFMRGAAVIKDKEGNMGIGGNNALLLPEQVAKKLEEGWELGDIMDQLQGVKNTKQKWGAMGFFTKGRFDRRQNYEHGILCALSVFLHKELY